MTKSKLVAASLVLGSLCIGNAYAKSDYNPVDVITNQSELPYEDVTIAPRDMEAHFVRDGIVRDPIGFRAVVGGLTAEQIEEMLGAPLSKSGKDWDYNFKFPMPQSDNYLVCQYKVRFDNEDKVESSVWRRRQCQALVSGALSV